MNRQQRRHGIPVERIRVRPLTFQHGHDGTHVVIVFSLAVQNVKLTPAECDAMIAALQGSKQRLLEHQEKQKAEAAHG